MPKRIRNGQGLMLNPVSLTLDDLTTTLDQYEILYVGVSGDITITPWGGDVAVAGDKRTFVAVPVGFFPVPCEKVWDTGTTAASIIGGEQA